MTNSSLQVASSSSSSSSQWAQEINNTHSLAELDEIRVRLLGKSGELTVLLKELGTLPPEQRKERGAQINQMKQEVSDQIQQQVTVLQEKILNQKLQEERLDVTLSPRPEETGTIHPITRTIQEFIAHFSALGFDVAYGPDIEDEEHNFNALNIPEHHPARQSHDTFYLDDHGEETPSGGRRLLRTHTSPVQIRTLRSKKPPLRLIVPGRVYRFDHIDATHSPMFHQVEGLIIEKGIHFGHLKSCVADFCKAFFEVEELKTRFRPSFFPFTEPSAELDIGYERKKDTIKIGTGDQWLEMGGCGMVHPNVLKNCDIDPNEYQGFAFGFGVERFAMLKYGISDLRSMYDSDIRWLRHFGFSPLSGL